MNILRLMLLFGFCTQLTVALGCFCVTPDDSVQNADVIFTGIVQEINNDEESYEESYYNLFWATEFLIDSVIKGLDYFTTGDKVTILQESTNCMFSFDQDSAYVVFAKYAPVYEEEPNVVYPFLATSQCAGTNKFPRNKITHLSEKENVADESDHHNRRRTPNGWLVGSALLNVLLILALLYVRRGK